MLIPKVTLTGNGFDEDTKFLMYPDIGNRKMVMGSLYMEGLPYSVAVSDDKAYVGCGYEPGLQVIDISDPENPQTIAYVKTPSTARSVAISEDKAYVAYDDDWGRPAGLQVIDISDAKNPITIASVDTQSIAYGVAVSNDKVYLAGSGDLKVIDISDPKNPSMIGYLDTLDSAFDITVSDGKAYVADGESGLQVNRHK
ncbi:LVIVD repeat-containing protein [Desulfonema magnum]|uniref:LVIVD repeat-containing protein n=1 Tax=Desulfonema magnum TaxID=45655 RepID=A0A975BRG0_9BACT|nr:hypothetical protein [Desulfonema magnum]QTA89859.1 LVIVD repeat-containing protein [Desulfonema magnum]